MIDAAVAQRTFEPSLYLDQRAKDPSLLIKSSSTIVQQNSFIHVNQWFNEKHGTNYILHIPKLRPPHSYLGPTARIDMHVTYTRPNHKPTYPDPIPARRAPQETKVRSGRRGENSHRLTHYYRTALRSDLNQYTFHRRTHACNDGWMDGRPPRAPCPCFGPRDSKCRGVRRGPEQKTNPANVPCLPT